MTQNVRNDDKIEAAEYSRREFIGLAGMGIAIAGTLTAIAQPVVTDMMEGGPPPVPQGEETWTKTVCQICPAGCGLDVRRIDNRVVKVEGNPLHRLNHGRVCPKAHANTQVLYDPDRLQNPMRRVGDRGGGQWEEISWDEALATLTEKLGELQTNNEAHTALFLKGSAPGHLSDLIDRFCQAYGTPNVAGSGSQCTNAERASHLLTQGWYDQAAYDWGNNLYTIFFGGSFLEDWQPQVQMLSAYSFIRRGRPTERGRITQVGSRLSVSAHKADEWVPIKPGTEGALALAMTHVIIKENQHDQTFIEDHTSGFEEFSAMVLADYSPETVSGITGVPAETIKRLARELAGARPAIAAAGQGLGIGTNAVFTHAAINALNAVLGSIDIPGGVLKQRYPAFAQWPDVSMPEISQPRLDGAGGENYPLANCVYHELPDHILNSDPYPVKALLMVDSNPVFDSAGANRWQAAMAEIPFIVSFSSIADESAQYADLLLPDHTSLERLSDVTPPAGIGRAIVGIGAPAVEPLYNTRHTGDVLLGVAQTLGGSTAAALPFANYEELLKHRFEGIFNAGEGSIQAASFDEFWTELLNRGVWEGPRYQYGNWEEVLTTESGTFEFNMSLLAQDDEVAVLPHFEPPVYAGNVDEYPLHLITYQVLPDAGNRAPNAPILWDIYGVHIREAWGNWLEINPETAHNLGISDGDMVSVESPEGQIQLKARLYDGAMPDAVNIPLGGGHTAGGRWASAVRGANPAEIVVPQSDPLAGTAAWLGTRVKVSKA
jgi:anaerobic selenocysteine-containing dehydrogenase